MDSVLAEQALAVRERLVSSGMRPKAFRRELRRVPRADRDSWLDMVFDIDPLPDDVPLPQGCVPYLPSAVDSIVEMTDLSMLRADEVFVDIGCGLGRVLALTHLLTGAAAVGIEIQPQLAAVARQLASRLRMSEVSIVEGDAVDLIPNLARGDVFFLYCPFGGERLEQVLEALHDIARAREIRVCSLDLPLAPRAWLQPIAHAGALSIYRSDV